MDNKEQEYLDTPNRSLQYRTFDIETRMMEKMDRNISNILHNISKMKVSGCRKYQISGFHEWKRLKKELCNMSDIKFELVNDETLTKNKLMEITGGYDRGSYTSYINSTTDDCTFHETKVPIMYIRIKKLGSL